MSTPRRVATVLLFLFFLLVAAGVWWWRQENAMNPLERWCAAQLRRIAGDLLAPELDFSTLELELPVTVTLSDVSLTSNGVAIVKTSSMRLEFRDRPKRGQPLVIRVATFVDPEVRLIERADGTLEGFSGFVKSTKGKRYEDGGSSRPSDFLDIRQLSIKNGMIEWAQHGHERPMEFDQLAMDLAANPDPQRAGWYAIKANVDRPPIVQLTWNGGVSIDTGDVALDDVTLQVDLSRDEYSSLSPSIQDVLRQYSIVGDLTAHATGQVPLRHTDDADLTFDVTLKNAGAAVGDYQFPIDSARMKATYRQMQLACSPLTVQAFGGQIDATGSVGFADPRAFTMNVKVTDVLIQEMLRLKPGKPVRLAGKVGLSLDASGERQDFDSTMKGKGKLTITDATLIGIPAVDELAEEVEAHPHDNGHDRGDIDFTLESDRVTLIGRSVVQSSFLAAHGKGDIHYDGRLDMTVNAGVVEKAETLLGEIGDVLAVVTDMLLPYKISGTWSKPIVKPDPLGLPIREKRSEGG